MSHSFQISNLMTAHLLNNTMKNSFDLILSTKSSSEIVSKVFEEAVVIAITKIAKNKFGENQSILMITSKIYAISDWKCRFAAFCPWYKQISNRVLRVLYDVSASVVLTAKNVSNVC